MLPGQHVDIRLTAEDGYSTARTYSVSDARESRSLEVTVERLEDGEVSPLTWSTSSRSVILWRSVDRMAGISPGPPATTGRCN